MGLAGPKNRTKFSRDPNNTAWAKSTDSYGHKILRSHGWQPGEYLGARDASHAEHYTSANASHIRVLLREENLGLGAKTGGASNADTFGLSLFSSILGRLNGKTEEEVKKQEDAQRNVELKTYLTRKLGSLSFVSGGWLVGDEIDQIVGEEQQVKVASAQETGGERVKSGNKRKADRDTEMSEDKVENPAKRKKRIELDASDEKPEPSAQDLEATTRQRLERDKKRKAGITHQEREALSTVDMSDSEQRHRKEKRRKAVKPQEALDDESTSKEDKAARKAQKKRAKEEKRASKEERRRRREEKQRAIGDAVPAQKTVPALTAAVSSTDSTRTSTPQPAFAGGRYAVRQRYIQQKRLASMNAQALKEIFMVKAPV